MATDFLCVCVCMFVCVCVRGEGWGFAEIGGRIVVCARELQRAIKMDVEVSHWNAYALERVLLVSLCVCV